MPPEDEKPRPPLKPWILTLAVGSVAVIILGVFSTYKDLSGGAVIVLLGLIGLFWAGWAAGDTSDDT